MAGLDEARARSALAEMQERLARGPFAALGIPPNASPEEARAAFLQLTKRYHPVRFGRMAPELQKLANEVFLALRAAHDSFARSARRTAPMTQPLAVLPPPVAAPPPPATSRTGQPSPARGTRLVPHETGDRPAVASPGTAAPAPGPARITAARPAVPPGAPPPARASGITRPTGSAAASARDEAAVLDLLQRQQWDQARSALTQLTARDPSSKRVRALVCYARGREAQLERRFDDARVELQSALDLDPDLQPAKTALTELFTRRK